MIVKKLRLQRGWSQEQLAELTDLSIRTIQRVERGQSPSLETARSLATIFEVNITVFKSGEHSMKNKELLKTNKTQHEETTLKDDEKEALNYVKGIKEFLSHGLIFIFSLIIVLIKIDTISNDYFWPFVVWAIGLTIHGLMAFEWLNLDRFGIFSPKWEKKIIEKRIGRKL